MKKKAIYIFGVIANSYPADLFVELEKLDTYVIPFEDILAVVTEKPQVEITGLSAQTLGHFLLDHQRTIEKVMEIGFVGILPMQLGTFAQNRNEVKIILEKGYNLIKGLLNHSKNQLEIDIIATWNHFPRILHRISSDPEIERMKHEMQKTEATVSQSDQLKLGFLVKSKIDQQNKSYRMTIMEALAPFALNHKSHEVMNDEMVMNTAFLMEKGQQTAFEQALERLDDELEGEVNFKFVGPLPCYSFFTLEKKELNSDLVEKARMELGLSHCATPREIKQAYIGKAKLHHPDRNTGIESTNQFDHLQKAYRLLLDYASAVRQTSDTEQLYFEKDKIMENALLIKIKD